MEFMQHLSAAFSSDTANIVSPEDTIRNYALSRYAKKKGRPTRPLTVQEYCEHNYDVVAMLADCNNNTTLINWLLAHVCSQAQAFFVKHPELKK